MAALRHCGLGGDLRDRRCHIGATATHCQPACNEASHYCSCPEVEYVRADLLRGAVDLANLMIGTLEALWTGAKDGQTPDAEKLRERIDWYRDRLGGR